MNYNEYFGKGNQNAGYGTSGTPETTPENWDDYFDGQSVHVPIQTVYADSPQVTTQTVPNKGRSYMDVTPIVTERPSHEQMLNELQLREAAHRMAQQQKDYYKTWDQKVRQMDEETRGDMKAQVAPGSKETGKLSDYFDMEPGDFGYNQALGSSSRPHGKAKKVVFTEDGPVFAEEYQPKKPADVKAEEDAGLKAILKKKPVLPIKEKNAEPAEQLTNVAKEKEPEQDILTTGPDGGLDVGNGLTIEDLQNIAPINEQLEKSDPNEISIPEELLTDDEPADEEPAGFLIPDFGEDVPELELEPEDDYSGEDDAAEPVTEEEVIPEEPVMEIVAGEAEVDGIEEDVVEEPDIDGPAEETQIDDNMFGGIDITDIPEDIPENLDEEYDRKMAERAAKKKTPGRKKSDKTVKTTKKKTTASKTTAKKSGSKKK